MTAYCMDLLGAELRPLKQAEAAGRLVPQVGMPQDILHTPLWLLGLLVHVAAGAWSLCFSG